MEHNGNGKEIAKINRDIAELDRKIKQLEFQSKKDWLFSQKRFDDWDARITKKISHIAQLAGITYEELDNLDLKVRNSGKLLSAARKRSTL